VATDVRHQLTVPAVPASLDRVHGLLAEVWSANDEVSADDRMRFEIGLIEIAGNIVEHAASPAPRDFTLVVEVHPDRLEARFRDPGRRVEVDFDNAAMPEAMAESGRGLALVLAVVDELTYRHDGVDNHWLVVRRRAAV
jgi:serine/threonine-protein kinase RsbW